MKDEKRRFVRVHMPVPVKISRDKGVWEDATALNISKDGIRIRFDNPPDTRSISRNMTIRIGKIPSEKSIKVRWRKDTDVGAEFNNTLNNKIYTTIVKSME
ncbi:MAG TPA: PilZ domain-containing protein [Deltaproteobacteria bacterium]|nr:MAG: hypothetical protein DRG37_01270 [Deltaproteobacteria bacterium]HDM32743.1 PilZ domain-containing protein [Deltaproteobacteria bacterium]